MPVTVICNVSQRQVVVNRLELGGGWGSAPDWRQAGSRALEQQRLGCQRGSGRRSVNHQVTLYWQSGPRWRGPVSLLIRGPAGAPCAPAVPWAHPWAGAQHHGAPRRAHVAAEARCQKVPRFAGRAQRGPQTTPLLLAGGSLRSPPAPPTAAACRPARGVAAGTVCAIMQGQAAPMARRRCRPCIIAQPVPYRGPGRTSPVGQRARCRSRLIAGPTLVGPGHPAL